VNEEAFDAGQHTIVSLGSCTTNAIVPMLHVLQEVGGIKEGTLTTIHAYTNSQALLDVNPSVKNPQKSRAAGLNIIPTTTGAMDVLERVLPALKGKITGSALRVPIPIVSLAEIVLLCERSLDKKKLHEAYQHYAQTTMRGILSLSYDPLVSSDFNGNSSSVTIDTLMTVTSGFLIKVYGWYDNEWGYSCRLKDFLVYTTIK
jgi:glyceraldehyde 3-phosphate dehydrogenase